MLKSRRVGYAKITSATSMAPRTLESLRPLSSNGSHAESRSMSSKSCPVARRVGGVTRAWRHHV
eukprot:5053624-Prymnesium_polylepis.1